MVRPRVLFLGEGWFGSCARACSYALRHLGCEVRDIDSQLYFPPLQGNRARAIARLTSRVMLREYNEAVMRAAVETRAELVVAFKAPYVSSSTLRQLKASGLVLCNYYPDTSMFAHGPLLPEALPCYDRIFTTKPFGTADAPANMDAEQMEYLPHGYDPELHRATHVDEDERRSFACDVSVIATYTQHKEFILAGLLRERPNIDLRVWGNGWRRTVSRTVRARVVGHALIGSAYTKAICSAKVNLALLSGEVVGASSGDETSTRTFEIPACQAMMLHPRTPEVLGYFREPDEVACYGDIAELCAQVDRFLADPDGRMELARRGYQRAVPAYSYEQRMKRILEWYGSREAALHGFFGAR